ncbi:MAG TPA: acyloxyacyl hydrolase [Bacillota bacterium]|nr:acyloxyacyl hydrolase [Bacillota bacterium]
MHLKGLYCSALVLFLFFFQPVTCIKVCAVDLKFAEAGDPPKSIEIETEYLWPIHANREIDTVSLNVFYGKEPALDKSCSFYYGVTLTNATGTITYQYPHRESSAFGVGPVMLLRYAPYQGEKLSVSIDGSGGLIFYNKEFPAGGDFYNFMWRFGPKLIYRFSDRGSITFGYKWMHVSNGQHDHNPSYDADGFSLGMAFRF